MKKLSTIILAAVFALSTTASFGQDATKDQQNIKLTAWVPPTIDGMPAAARLSLANKLSQVVTKNGLGGTKNARFIISANVTINTKNILPGPPPMHAYGLDVTLYIGDGFEGTVFSSHNITVKGVGKNPTKAYKSALKNIRTKDPEIAAFVEEGKAKIIQYYKDNCDRIIKEAQTLADQDKYPAAIYKLTSVPTACGECYDKSMAAVKPIYQKQIDQDCKKKLAEATGIWNSGQDMDKAEQAGSILAKINPDASCAAQARTLSNKIAAKVKQIDAREWKYTVKDQQQESERIKAMRDVGVAYGKGPKANVTYRSLF